MDFALSARAENLAHAMWQFLVTEVLPAEAEYDAYRHAAGPDDHTVPPVVETLKAQARSQGLWNLFSTSHSDLSNVEYASLAEISGWSTEIFPEAINCQAPDSGNMETLALFGTTEQQRTWLAPLLDGQIRSAFAMTEPSVASSDATNIECHIRRDGDDYVVNGVKWWISGANDPRCRILIVMGKTDPDGPRHRQQSMVLVPIDTPGVSVRRSLPVFGRQDQHGHAEIELRDVRVPAANLLASEGDGFVIAQARLGPGRIHHCMRAIGAAERALSLMVERARTRVAFGRPLAEQGLVQDAISRSRVEIDQSRLLTLRAAWVIDQHGSRAATNDIAAIKLVAPTVATRVIDRAIQVHGGAGIGDDLPLARSYGWHRAMRIFDGPDEVHIRSIARAELAHPNGAPPRWLGAAT
jgi:acyl-CoA dehydrogenase